ncbi:MAG TPA: BON domain-containing protein [Alphaproteobacteria bacterium]|nr:BON domain-containing protein [Alphaproteobacteria bacterium]
MIRNIQTTLLVLPVLLLGGCTGVGLLTGAAAVTGISAAQEGGLDRAYTDTKIKVNINDAWFQYDVDAFRKLSTTVNQGRVLITGVVQDPQQRVEAVRLAWQVKGVTQVINEIRVAESEGVTGFVKDGWITSKLRTALTFDRGVQSINYSIDTVQGVVYLMGVAQNQAELNRVIETARTTSGVKQVVSYVKLAGEPLAEAKPAEPPAAQDFNNDPQPIQNTNTTNTNLKTNEITDDVDVPARSVPEGQPSIQDQYYNN